MGQIGKTPLTVDQSKAARRELALSQKDVIAQTGIQAYKVKQFEAGSFRPDMATLRKLREFYEGQGVNFEELSAYLGGGDDEPQPGAKARQSGQVFPSGVVAATGDDDPPFQPKARPTMASFHHMRIALADPEMGHVLDLIEENEERAAELLAQPVKSGVFDRLSDKAEATHAQVLKLLADNGMLFAKLFGRTVGGEPKPEALKDDGDIKTHADLLHRVHADTHLAAKGDQAAKERRKRKPLGESLASAIFG